MSRAIEVSESTYQVLLTQASRLQLPLGHVVERLVLSDLLLMSLEKVDADLAVFATDSASALAAVERLTTLFADIHLNDLEIHLHDPLLALANVDLDLLLQ
jgi:hypothetical protein